MAKRELSNTDLDQLDSSTCLFEGDIRVSCDIVRNSEGARSFYSGISNTSLTWPGAKIPYAFGDKYGIHNSYNHITLTFYYCDFIYRRKTKEEHF